MGKKSRIFIILAILMLALMAPAAWGEDDEPKPGVKTPVERMETPKATKPAKSGFGIGLRLHGGMNWLQGGDINKGIEGYLSYTEFQADWYGYPYARTFNEIRQALNGGVDLLFYLGRRFGLSLGASYLKKNQQSRLDIIFPTSTMSIFLTPEVEALPVDAGLFYILPLGNRFNLMVEAGGGWTFARLKYDYQMTHLIHSETASREGDAGGISGFARLGVEVKISRSIFFFVEALGRYAKISGFDGRCDIQLDGVTVDSFDGIFYSYDLTTLGRVFHLFDMFESPPGAPVYSNVREAEIDFSGVSARAGVRIRF